MANISDAHGVATITGKSVNSLVQLLYLQNLVNKQQWYQTNFADILELSYQDLWKLVLNRSQKTDRGDMTIKLDFYGTGRWCFKNNIEWFFSFIDSGEYEFSEEEYRMQNNVKEQSFSIDWEVSDSEEGMQFIEVYNYDIRWEPSSLKQVNGDFKNYTDFAYNQHNLMRLGFL